jgi:mannose-6-phosphate isomerase-like protein (cupin superfamily)
MQFHIPLSTAKEKLAQAPSEFVELFKHGTLYVELYQPDKIDKQQPHTRDEVYVVVAGSGTFYYDGERKNYKTGDVIFVPAGIEHRFEDFTDDFMTWVFFYGPEGGETETP